MAATFTITNHGTVSTSTTAIDALRTGRAEAGFPTRTYTGTTDLYKFTNGTGTYQDTYLACNITGTYYPGLTNGADIVLDANNNPNGSLIDSGGTVAGNVGSTNTNTRLYCYAQGSYRSLSFAPTTGDQYGAHIYQRFNSTTTEWETTHGEIFIKVENVPTAAGPNTIATTKFLYFDNYIQRPRTNQNDYWDTKYDGPKWMYVPPSSAYTGWGGKNPLGGIDRIAILTRNCNGSSSYLKWDNGGRPLTTNTTTNSYLNNSNVDLFARACDPIAYGVYNLAPDGVTAQLAKPFVIKHEMTPFGTANTDIVFGLNTDPGEELIVSAGEKYTSIGGSLYIRTT